MKKIILLLFMITSAIVVFANNVRVTNVSLINQDQSNNTWHIKFDVAWDNGWRTSTNEHNWDAAWVFIKYRASYMVDWKHARLLLTGMVKPAGAEINLSSPIGTNYAFGAAIYRNADGVGNVNFSNAQLVWSYGNAIRDNDKVEIAVFAIEMVYVPEGPFSIGDGTPEFTPTTRFKSVGSGNPFVIDVDNASLVLGGTSAENLTASNGNAEDFTSAQSKVLPAAFPKGFAGFYCMKYECSMGQYTEFLNKLPFNEAFNHYTSNGAAFGNTIRYNPNTNKFSTTTPDRACNYVSFNDAVAYADWAGLRMMTELQYEKACRGDNQPVPGEYANGVPSNINNENIDSTDITNAGTESEQFTNSPTIILPFKFKRPLRCGIIAASQTAPTRINTGATYYGIMEMSGNVAELCVGVSSASQRSYSINTSYEPNRYPESGSILFEPANCTIRGQITVLDIMDAVSTRSFLMQSVTERKSDVGFRCVTVSE